LDDVQAHSDPGTAAHPSLVLAFATIERPQVVQRLIASVRRHFPAMPIYVADQSLDVAAMASFYAQMQVTLIRMPYDAGVCASRNRLAASIAEDYFVLCDDDFVFGGRTDFTEALRILRHHPEIGVVGGKLYDYNGSLEYTRNWELFLHLDVVNRTLTSTPIFHYAPRAPQMGTTRFYLCDAVMNFAVMRRAIFAESAIRWDERFKSNGEHEDFFLNMKLNSSVRVAYLPTMVAYHHHPEAFVSYRAKLRERLEGWKQLFAKWNIDQHLEIGLGVRSIDDLNETVEPEQARDRFFLNDNLSLRRATSDAALLVGQGASLSAVGLLNETGEPNASSPAMARLLVRAAGGRVMTGPDLEPLAALARQSSSGALETPESRHSLVPVGRAVDLSRSGAAALFRYNPVARVDADFVLWYRLAPADGAQRTPRGVSSGTLAIHLRWFADNGGVLMWDSGPYLLDAGRTDYWAPLLVEVPLCPSRCASMRFEIVAGESAGRRPLATGFLFSDRSGDSTAARSLPRPAPDALALTPWIAPAPGALPPPARLDELAGTRSDAAMTPELCAQVPALMLLPTSALTDMDTVFLFGWPGLGAPLSIIHLPDRVVSGAQSFAPHYVALPSAAAPSVRIIGFIKGQGYREVALRRPAE